MKVSLDPGLQMIPFAGYSLPAEYSKGVMAEHLWTRETGKAGVFDVSHMGQLIWHGRDAADFLETVVVGDMKKLAHVRGFSTRECAHALIDERVFGGLQGHATLSLITNERGGIIDDTVITSYSNDNQIWMVVNGANRNTDVAYLEEKLREYKKRKPTADVSLEFMESRQLLALQGPGAAAVLQPLITSGIDLKKVPFMSGGRTVLRGELHSVVTRCGYTGEDGFEISVKESDATKLADLLLANPAVSLIGLGARDSLRLEAGLCLYGNDIDATTTPIEAGLAWTIPERRRKERGFPGADTIVAQLNDKTWARKRVGLTLEKVPARAGVKVFSGAREIGTITSGTYSPSLKHPVSMAYVHKDFVKKGTAVEVEIRGRRIPATIATMPFVPNRYYKIE